jgi:hypothetical protein
MAQAHKRAEQLQGDASLKERLMQVYADVCGRMLTRRMLTYADVC